MAENGNSKKYPTWQWLAGILIMLVLAFGGWAWSDTRSAIKENQVKMEQKVDKAQYDKDVTRIMNGLDVIQNDIKDLLKRKR